MKLIGPLNVFFLIQLELVQKCQYCQHSVYFFVTFASIQNDTQDIMTDRMDGMYVLTRKMPTRLVMWTEALKHGKSPANVTTKIYLLIRKIPTRLVMWTVALKYGKSLVNVTTKIYVLTRKIPTRLVMWTAALKQRKSPVDGTNIYVLTRQTWLYLCITSNYRQISRLANEHDYIKHCWRCQWTQYPFE